MTEEGQQGSSARRLTAEARHDVVYSAERSEEDIVSSWKEEAKRDAARRRHQEEIEKANAATQQQLVAKQQQLRQWKQSLLAQGHPAVQSTPAQKDGHSAALTAKTVAAQQPLSALAMTEEGQQGSSARRLTAETRHDVVYSAERSEEDIVSSWKEEAKRDAARRRHQEEIEKANAAKQQQLVAKQQQLRQWKQSLLAQGHPAVQSTPAQ